MVQTPRQRYLPPMATKTTTQLLRTLISGADGRRRRDGVTLSRTGAVAGIELVLGTGQASNRIRANVADDKTEPYVVEVWASRGVELRSSCVCKDASGICRHVVALANVAANDESVPATFFVAADHDRAFDDRVQTLVRGTHARVSRWLGAQGLLDVLGRRADELVPTLSEDSGVQVVEDFFDARLDNEPLRRAAASALVLLADERTARSEDLYRRLPNLAPRKGYEVLFEQLGQTIRSLYFERAKAFEKPAIELSHVELMRGARPWFEVTFDGETEAKHRVPLRPDGSVELSQLGTSASDKHLRLRVAAAILETCEALDDDAAEAWLTVIHAEPWQNVLDVLERAANPRPHTVSSGAGRLGWRLQYVPNDYGKQAWEIEPVIARRTSGGKLYTRAIKTDDLSAYPAAVSRADERAVQGLTPAGGKRPDKIYGHFIATALMELRDHPCLCVKADKSTIPLRVDVKPLILAAIEVEGGYAMEWRLGDRSFPAQKPPMFRFRAPFLGAFFVQPDHVIIAELDGFTATAYERLAELDFVLPPEAATELVDLVGELEARDAAQVSLPAGLAGEELIATSEASLQLELLSEGHLQVGVVIFPVEGSSSVVPGRGAEVLYGRIADATGGMSRFYCQRDLQAEEENARALASRLELAPDRLFESRIDEPTEALALLGRLKASGVHVHWATKRRYMTSMLRTTDLAIDIKRGTDWFDARIEANHRGTVIPLDQLLRAISERQRFVSVDDERWFEIDQAVARRLLPLANRERLDVTAAPLLDALSDAGVEIRVDDAWRAETQRMRDAHDQQFSVPEGLNADLRGYQSEGFGYLARMAYWAPGACLADDMGLGKTVQALALLEHRAELGPQLVLAPTSIGFNWEREAARFAPDLHVSLLRSRRDFDEVLSDKPVAGELWIMSYDQCARRAEELAEIPWTTLVIDEAQAIKNPATARAQAVAGLNRDFTLALTGTPVENNVSEVWSLFFALVPGLLGSRAGFRRRFAVPIHNRNDQVARSALADLIRPFVLRRTKDQVAQELPPRTEIQLDVELTEADQTRYEEIRVSALAELQRDVTESGDPRKKSFAALVTLMRMRQMACDMRLIDPNADGPSAKLERAVELIERLRAEGHRALIFSQFTTLLGLLRASLEQRGVSYRYLDGSTSPRRRQVEVDAFQEGDGDVFLLSLKAGGTGLNLTAASYVIHLDPWWNPAVEDQATDRAHRIGQDKPVTVYRLVSKGTVEEGIMKLHAEKRALADALLAGTGQSAGLSYDQIVELLQGPPVEAPKTVAEAVAGMS